MSLTQWVEWDKELIDSLCEKPKINMKGCPLLVCPLTKHYSMVGTAFDYLLRLIVMRENNLDAEQYFPIVAEHVAFKNKARMLFIDAFRGKVEDYSKGNGDIYQFIPDTISLAKMDSIYRSGMEIANSEIFYVDGDDAKDLWNLIGMVDTRMFHANEYCLLNPTFGQSSIDIIGADADIIIDGMLIDIKTTKEMALERKYFRQLVGYHILNIRECEEYWELDQPEINKMGLYFSRYGRLVTMPTPTLMWDDIMTKVNGSIQEYQEVYFHSAYLEQLDEDQYNYYKEKADNFSKCINAMWNVVGHKFDIMSAEQVKTVLFIELKLPRPSNGKIMTAIDDLDVKHPIINLLKEYRMLRQGCPKLSGNP